MRREAQFTPEVLASLLAFLATRQIYAGAGRVGQANPLAFDFEIPNRQGQVPFQISQRADHIVNDIYQWVQFNRAIINARDEPLADYRKYRRLHLLIGDSNMSPFATALKVGTTVCVLTLLEEDLLPRNMALRDAVLATREISRDPDGRWLVELDDGSHQDALEIQYQFLEHAHRYLAGQDEETDWILESWGFTLDAIRNKPELLLGGVDWISKKWLLNVFMEEQGIGWQDPWLQSLDLEYHNINPERGLFFALKPAKAIGEFNATVRLEDAKTHPPANTRATGRSKAVSFFQRKNLPYIINWDSIALESQDYLPMPDPFHAYADEVECFFDMSR
jgi:proteasome accessory factor A